MSTFKGSFEDFVTRCKRVNAQGGMDGDLQESYYPNTGYYNRRQSQITDKPRLYVEWSTGGISGGSCWDTSNPEPYTSNDPPKDLGILDAILENMCPTISFLQYKVLYNTLVKYDTYSVGEYYGNSTDYANKQIDLRALFDYLVEKQFIQSE